MSINSYDFSSYKKGNNSAFGNGNILNLGLKESPNYQSIMDIWSDKNNYTNSKFSLVNLPLVLQQSNKNYTASYFTKECDDKEMENTDEGVTDDERRIPAIAIMNLMQAIINNNIPEDLDRLLRSSTRFRMTGVKKQLTASKDMGVQRLNTVNVSFRNLLV